MSHPRSSTAEAIPPIKAKVPRARSLPSARPFRVAVFFSSLHYLCLIASATALTCFLLEPSQAASRALVAGMALSVLTWLVAFIKRRSTLCPLCKGTPLLNGGARVHIRAKRFPPLNHGVSANLSILGHQKFRCMYCGSDFDLLKPRTRLLYGMTDDEDYSSDRVTSPQDKDN